MLAFGTATIVVAVGLVIAFILVRTGVRGRGALEYLCNLPMGISGTALAMGLIFMYLTPPLTSLRLYGTLGILLVAYCTTQIPVGVRYSQPSLLQINVELEEASRVAGATWLQTLGKSPSRSSKKELGRSSRRMKTSRRPGMPRCFLLIRIAPGSVEPMKMPAVCFANISPKEWTLGKSPRKELLK